MILETAFVQKWPQETFSTCANLHFSFVDLHGVHWSFPSFCVLVNPMFELLTTTVSHTSGDDAYSCWKCLKVPTVVFFLKQNNNDQWKSKVNLHSKIPQKSSIQHFEQQLISLYHLTVLLLEYNDIHKMYIHYYKAELNSFNVN